MSRGVISPALAKNHKTPGPDGINNLVLKNMPRMVLVYLTYVFNASMKIQYFLKQWRQASVVAIPKVTHSIALLTRQVTDPLVFT
jgi:hypothetical protein